MSGASVEVVLFKAADGDCILIRCLGESDVFNILVDAGRPVAVERLAKYLEKVDPAERKIDLFVVTHIDSDHIAGAIRVAKDTALAGLVDGVWFNGAKHMRPKGAAPLSIAEGNEFQKLIDTNGWTWNGHFAGEAVERKGGSGSVQLANEGRTTATLLGPCQGALFELGRKWPLEEEPDRAERANGALAMGSGTELEVAALADEPYNRDNSPRNGTSIAFVLQHGPVRLLVCGDSHSETLVEAIDEDHGGSLKVDGATAPHHGAAGNMSPDLARRVATNVWFVSTEGGKQRTKKPDRAAVARALHLPKRSEKIRLIFNSDHAAALVWKDAHLMSTHRYETSYPAADDNWISFTLPAAPTS